MAAEVSHKRRIAGVINPGVLGPGVRRHSGLHGYGEENMAIDGTLIHDISALTQPQTRCYIRSLQTLRHSPMGVYPNSASYIGSGPNHAENIPCFQQVRYYSPQYAVNQASGVARVAIACGLTVKHNHNHEFFRGRDIALRIQSTSSLLLGIGGWIHCATGLNAGLASGWGAHTNNMPEWAHSIMPASTDNFIVDKLGREQAGIAAEVNPAAQYFIPILLQWMFMRAQADAVPLGFGQMNVPWWYVAEVCKKMGCVPKYKSKQVVKRFGQALGFGNRMCTMFTSHSQWTDLHMLMSDISYETRHWNIVIREDEDAAQVEGTINFFPDHCIDVTREDIAFGAINIGHAMPDDGVLSTTITQGDYLVQYDTGISTLEGWMTTTIFGQTMVEPRFEEGFPHLLGGLKYPDPVVDWLWEGAKKVAPHIITGDFIGAATTSLFHLTEPAITWAGDRIGRWVQDRFH